MNIYGLLFLFLILCSILQAFKPKIKGWLGEKTVATLLSTLPKAEYRTVHDVLIPARQGTTQIDHIVVSIYGVFVIETKNYKGWITGKEHGATWVKHMYGKKYSFQNPLRQNYAHVKALSALLEIDEDQLIPIVVFSLNADLKVETKQLLIYTKQLSKTIRGFNTVLFTHQEVDNIYKKIQESMMHSKASRKQHISDIKEKVNIIEQGEVCPRCGCVLVERKGTYGTFMGCSSYPKCRYTRKKEK